MVAIGRARLRVDDTNLDQKMGLAFGDGMSSGANNCYVDSLMKTPGQQGEITFVVKPPPGDGYYAVALQAQGSISAALVECVRRVFGAFYHYANKGTFDSLKGTLTFVPEMISAPAPPSEAALRAILDEQYSRQGIVRIARSTLKSATQDVEEPEVFRRHYYELDLEFIADGYEATCRHFQTYKVFGRGPYKAPYMGHQCENRARKRGDHTTDIHEIDLRLTYYPSMAKGWEVRPVSEQHLGTRPGGERDDN